MTRTVAVTGASGFVGAAVVAGFESVGDYVIKLGRQVDADSRSRHFDLGGRMDGDLLADVDILVHCGWDLTARGNEAWEVNVTGSRRLFDAFAGKRLLFVSSMSAHRGTRQEYGLTKLAVEAAALARGGIVVRPGLVYSQHPGGMVGAFVKYGALPVTPAIGLRSRQYPVHLDDVVAAIVALSHSAKVPPGPVGICPPDAEFFGDILRTLSFQANGRSPRLLPLPWVMAYAALRALEVLTSRAPFRADSVLGLVNPAKNVPNAAWLNSELTVVARPFLRATP
ncbi:MAG TPA: NAD-dependent epimerase/dehydratase family protein [Acidimicrobiales bacterium]|nr:NAD-dependent epimerase/dehydratase family protein [Acidimicrobiales bacterium]